MYLWDDIKDYARQLKVYAFGKGILTLLVFGTAGVASLFGVTSVMLPATLAAIGGVLVTGISRFYRQSLYEQQMVDFYREGIAARLHIAPEDVTKHHLHEVAPENPVIAQALDRQRKKTILTIATAVFSSAISLFLIGALDAGELLHATARESFTGALKPIASFIGIGTVSAITGLILHEGVANVIGYRTGITRASAHDKIMEINQSIQRGKPISREQVYGVMVAANPVLQHTIERRFGENYAHMTHAEQARVLHTFSMAAAMDDLAQEITQHHIAACELAGMQKPEHDTPVADGPTRTSFVERLDLAPRDNAAGHAAHVLKNRSRAQAATSIAT